MALDWAGVEQAIVDSAVPNICIVDCTASEDVGNMYEGWLRSGYHVITPNKKAGSGDLAYYKRIRNISRSTYTHWFAEATVGAGLPILNTAQLLTNTGDQIQKIEGILSGTLSYIFNNYDGSMPFSEVVKQAKELGYTEPDPRDDLSGTDVARKVVILAREAGLDVSMEDVPIDSLVPDALTECSVDEFMAKLPDYDDEMTGRLGEAAARGEVLRFVGVVDRATGKGSVELKSYTKEHAFGQLNGSDNMVCFHTKRLNSNLLLKFS
jgi:aspartokinase/homoserine dehydrogenase 1